MKTLTLLNKLSALGASCALLAAGLLAWPATAVAQAPKVMPLNPSKLTPQQIPELRTKASFIAQGAEPLAGNEAAFDQWFVEFIFPPMTNLSDSLSAKEKSLAKQREAFRKGMVNTIGPKAPQAHNRLNQLTLKTMGDIAGDKEYHPYIRINAMTMVADLNIEEPQARVPGKPMPETFPVLMRAVQSEDTPDGVKVAALNGLARHMQAKLPPDKADAAQELAMKIAMQAKAPAGRTLEGHDWIRRRAIDILAAGGDAGKRGVVAAAMRAIAADPSLPLSLRCTAARGLGSLNYGGAVGFDAAGTANDLGGLATEAVRREVDDEDALSKQRLKSYLQSVKIGLTGGVAPGKEGLKSAPGAAAAVTAAVAQVDAAIKLLDAKADDDKVLEDLAKVLAQMQQVFKPAAPPEPPAVIPEKAAGTPPEAAAAVGVKAPPAAK